jgi:lipase chaperone LimK
MVTGVCLLVAMAAVHWWYQGESETLPARNGAALFSSPDASTRPAARTAFVTGLEALPPSLAGTEVDCALETGPGGHLKATLGLRHCFDYFLSAVGEESIGSLTARISAQLHKRLQQPALGEAERVLGGYIAYLQGVAEIEKRQELAEPGHLDLDKVRQQMGQVQALRRIYLSPDVIAAFFDDDDSYDRYTLARLELLQNKKLSAQARAQQLAALQQQLPEDIKSSLKGVNQYLDLHTLTEEWKQRAGSREELRQIRTSLVGEEAATRLETLDQENSAWDGRMSDWYAQRDAVLKNPGLSQDDRQRQLEDLRNSRFASEAERLRVQTLERIHDQSAGGNTPPS